ncbi:MAG TPA: translocation/assembly module TamB domain-containing protein [Bryobacteraceae bacterium]|nr:translocation/assembly module TamB domain-containing protein [Bryobacteraceae bacterium]
MRRLRKIAAFTLLAGIGLAAIVAVVGFFVIQTAWFRDKIRQRIQSQVERATGGRVEIGGFSYNWHTLTVAVGPFVIHGTEPAGAPPLLRAEKIQIALRIISAVERKVDIASLLVESPNVYISINPDGDTNIPRPKVPRGNKNVLEDLLDLHVQHIDIHHGIANYNSWRVPLDASGEGFKISLRYENGGQGSEPRYLCSISSARMRISSPKLRAPTEFALDSQLELRRNTILVQQGNLAAGGMKIQARGAIEDLYSPQLNFDVTAMLPVADLNRVITTPLESRGDLWLQGHASAGGTAPDRFVGKVAGHSLAYSRSGMNLRDIAVSANADFTPNRFSLTDVQLSSAQGRFRGSARMNELGRAGIDGEIQGVSVAELGRLAGRDMGSLAGTLDGHVQVAGRAGASGVSGVVADATLDLKPGEGAVPVSGALQLHYDQPSATLQIGESQINVRSTQATLAGTPGQSLAVHLVSRNLDDVLPVLRAFGAPTPDEWPVQLESSAARIDANVTGPLASPAISGKADAGKLKVAGRELDRASATFIFDRNSAALQNVVLEQGKMQLEGSGRAELKNWKLEDSSPVSASVSLKNADIRALAAEAGWNPGASASPLSGSMSAAMRISGSLGSPVVSGTLTSDNLQYDEQGFDHARADVTFTPTALEVSHGEARMGAGRITFSSTYNHLAKDWRDGSLRFDVATTGMELASIKRLQDYQAGLGGHLDLKAAGSAKIVSGSVDLTSLAGSLTVRNAALDGRTYGNLTLTAATSLPVLKLTAVATFEDVQIRGSGEWRMEGDYRGEAHIPIPRISVATLHDLAPGKHVREKLPFEGFIEGEATVSGPLNQPSAIKAEATLSTVQLNASQGTRPAGEPVPQDLVLHNAQPLHIALTTNAIDFGHASFIAKDTTIDASGRLLLNSKNPWDAAIQGRINFSILRLFNPDLLGSGVSVVNVTVRGPLTAPQIDGRLELQNASLFIRDVPNGVDNANGVILFDRNRATVQNLTGKSGGGEISFEPGSFLGFRGTGLVYRLSATARNVRYRSPEGLSITADGSLALVGTSENSVLSGAVSLTRAAFSPTTDVGSLLASTTRPVANTPNPYLPGLQLDVRLLTQRTLEVETALTRNIQADADLRVRGTPDRPVLLGHITVNSGQIEFFGNKYSINRGEITFNNPARNEPVINMDLSTRVRGITVNIAFSGSLNNLNFSYRSDPPLEASDIVALLAVGRTPSSAGPLGTVSSATSLNNSILGTGGSGSNSLLSQAIQPNSSRLQKFFGVSHIKIDPQLTDVTIVPQARLTMEQQVSSDVTLTYIQNLAISDQQIVRVEWDFSRKWSAVALRDENGAFSIDFQYRKRFK